MASKRTPKKKFRKTRKRGGEFVGQGTYGCGFYPGFPCQGDNSVNTHSFFTKLMYTRYAIEEWKISETMRILDPTFKFSVYPYKMCLPRMEDVDRYIEEGVSQCSLRSPHEFYRIKDDKYTLRSLIRHKSIMMLQSEQAGVNLHTIEVSPVELYSFFKGFTNLFNGIEYYQNKGFYHLDIKPSNIVSRRELDGSYTTRFIDFGMGKYLSEIMTEAPEYMFSDYIYYPYELRFLGVWPVLKNKNFDASDDFVKYYMGMDSINQYINNQLRYVTFYVPQENYYAYNSITTEYVPQISETYYRILAKSIDNRNNLKKPLSKELYKQLLNATDVFALGLTLAEVFRRLVKHYMHFNTVYKAVASEQPVMLTPQTAEFPIEYILGMEISKPMYNLIKAMTDRNPFMRMPIKDAKAEFKAIVEKMKPFFGMANMNEHPEIATLFGTANGFVENLPPPPPTPPHSLTISPPSPSTPSSPIGQYIINSPISKKGGNKTRRRVKKSNLKK